MALSHDNVEMPIESYEELYDMLASGAYRAVLTPKGAQQAKFKIAWLSAKAVDYRFVLSPAEGDFVQSLL